MKIFTKLGVAVAVAGFANSISAATKFTSLPDNNWPGGIVKWITPPIVNTVAGTVTPSPFLATPEFANFCRAVDFLQLNTQLSFEDMTPTVDWHSQDGCDECTSFFSDEEYVTIRMKRSNENEPGRSFAVPFLNPVNERINGSITQFPNDFETAGEYALANGESANGALHELLHQLYAGHEHQRADRDAYVDIDPIKLLNTPSNGAYDPVNYFKEFMPDPLAGIFGFNYDVHRITPSTDAYPFRMYGGFDQASIMRYTSGMMLKLNSSDLLWHIKQPHPGFQRDFRILLKDGTASPYDNLAINNEPTWTTTSTGPLVVSTFQDGWHTAQFDIEYVGTFWDAATGKNVDRFTIRHKFSGQYLFDNNGVVGFVASAGLAAKGGSAQWNLEAGAVDGDFALKSNGSAKKYMSTSGGSLSLAAVKPTTPWIIKARTLVDERPQTLRLSMMDKVGLHINYGKFFTIKHTDGTSSTLADNPTIGPVTTGSTVYVRARQVPNGSAPYSYKFTHCGNDSTTDDSLCIREAYIGFTIRTDSTGNLTTAYENTPATLYERWELIPQKEGYFQIRSIGTGKFWGKPQTVNGVAGVIPMVSPDNANIANRGQWLLNDHLVNGYSDYKGGKQRSQSCATALGVSVNY